MLHSRPKDNPKLPSVSTTDRILSGCSVRPSSDQLGPQYLTLFTSLEVPTAPSQQGRVDTTPNKAGQELWSMRYACPTTTLSNQQIVKLQNSEDLFLMTTGKPWPYMIDRKLNSQSQIICCFFLNLEKVSNFTCLPQWTHFSL